MVSPGTTVAVALAALLSACGGETERDFSGSQTGERPGSAGNAAGTGGAAGGAVSTGAAGAAGSSGAQACIPNCEGKECGEDGCGSRCAPGCSLSQTCNAGQCENLVYGPEGQSCSAMAGTECNGESCCTSIVVPGGTFPMGRGTEKCTSCTNGCVADQLCELDEEPEHPATVSPFVLDRYEVTVGRFRAFVEAFDAGWRPSEAGGANPAVESAQGLAAGATGWQSDWDAELATDRAQLEDRIACGSQDETWTGAAGANETYPMNCVNWYEAFAFCIWDNGRLPTEAEWEMAAAGGDENRVFSWGNDVTEPFPANYGGNHSTPFCPVGSEPDGNGRWGHADLAGSMWEWVLDGYDRSYYLDVQAGCSDCANVSITGSRGRRGGAWSRSSVLGSLRAASRSSEAAVGRFVFAGFRCARSTE
jgi:sulfatase modifying factor 1